MILASLIRRFCAGWFLHTGSLVTITTLFLLSWSPLFFILVPAQALAQPQALSERELVITSQLPQPSWKLGWDRARKLVRAQRWEEARQAYQNLLILKKDIEEARWEYGQLLIQMERWPEAVLIIDGLLEQDTGSIRYLAAGGEIALAQLEYERAAQFFGQLHEKDLDDSLALPALQGLVAALQGLESKEAAFPLMEQLYQRTPDDVSLLHSLARYAVNLEEEDRARVYYARLISEFGGQDEDLLAAARLFDHPGFRDQAVEYWLSYLQRHPAYLVFQKKVASYYLAQNLGAKALPHLLALLAHGDSRPELLLEVGEIYLQELHRPDRALYYLEEYRKLMPDDKRVAREITRVHAVLANDLLAIVENDGAWQLWRDLAKTTPDRLAIYVAMAKLLEQRGMDTELIEVLEIIHQQESTNQEVLFRLSELLLAADRLHESEYYLGLLDESWQATDRALLLAADLSEALGRPQAAYDACAAYLLQHPTNQTIRQRAFDLALELDLAGPFTEQYRFLRQELADPAQQMALGLQYAGGLVQNRLYGQAQEVIEELQELTDSAGHQSTDLLLLKARILQETDDSYAAERLLRQTLNEQGALAPVLRRLFADALASGQPGRAGTWLSHIGGAEAGGVQLPEDCNQSQFGLFIDQLQWLAATGKMKQALELGRRAQQRLQTTDCAAGDDLLLQLDLTLLRMVYQAGDYEAGRTLAAVVLQRYPDEVEVLVLSVVFGAERGEEQLQIALLGELVPARQLLAAALCYRYGLHDTALTLVRQRTAGGSLSVRATLLEADILRKRGELAGARLLLDELVQQFPGEEYLFRQRLNLMFQQGEFSTVIHLLTENLANGNDSEAEENLLPQEDYFPYWRHLLLARALWADRRHREAVLVYEQMLTPSADRRFGEQLQQAGAQLQLPPVSRSLIHILTFTHPADPERLDVVMSPDFFLKQLGQPVARISTALYDDYRWQQLVVRELSARKAMTMGDDFRAMNEYQSLAPDQTTVESLFDLAGVYSRLGMLGQEAAIYERIAAINPEYPGLDKAVSRNLLKRQTRVWSTFDYDMQKGRNSYLDSRRSSLGLHSWLMPDLRQEVELAVTRSYLTSDTTDQHQWRHRLQAGMLFALNDKLSLGATLAGEGMKGDSGVEPLFELKLRGHLADWGEGYVRFSKDVVDDTLESLERGINHRDLEGGVMVNLLPRFQLGGEYRYRLYSDNNHQNRYHVWGAYVLSREPLLLQLRYGYEYFKNDDSNLGRDFSFETGFQPGDHPYWSPGEFWQQLIGVHFEHQLARDISRRGVPSYYTVDYSLGYEFGGYDIHMLNTNIFLEISPDFLLNATVNVTHGSEYRREQASLSLIYRW